MTCAMIYVSMFVCFSFRSILYYYYYGAVCIAQQLLPVSIPSRHSVENKWFIDEAVDEIHQVIYQGQQFMLLATALLY